MYLPLKRKSQNTTSKFWPALAIFMLLSVWQLATGTGMIEEYLLPSHFSEQYFFFQDTLYFACRSSNDTSFNVVRISLEMIGQDK